MRRATFRRECRRASSEFSPSLPNAGIAQGAMFVITGDNLGPSSIVVASSFPLQTKLGGTSVQVTSGGQTVDAIMYYSQAQQIAAILPSNTPLGQGFVNVTYNGETNGAPILIVQNNVAMYTISQNGAGDAVATLADYSVVLPNNAPNPGDIVVFWADGLGPVQSDETKPAPAADMTSVPLEVYIGGKPATVLYRGRNPCCVSEDQINVQIPQGVFGCAVSVTMKIGDLVSNTTTIPIAAAGRICTPTNSAFSESDVARLLGKPSLNIGTIHLLRTVVGSPSANPILRDSVQAGFASEAAPVSLVLDTYADIPSYGSCITLIASVPLSGFLEQFRDAGDSIGESGPNGNLALAKQVYSNGPLYSTPSTTTPYLDPGPYTITGTGGPDIGSFRLNLSMPAALVWTNYGQAATVDRTQGVTVSWSGGDPSGYVTIIGLSYGDHPAGTSNYSVQFTCYARASDGGFTVPPYVLLALPVSGTASGIQPSLLQLTGTSAPVAFQASGQDLGWGSSSVSNAATVVYR
jgi:uncharacterized protein (TIGR03437 family)